MEWRVLERRLDRTAASVRVVLVVRCEVEERCVVVRDVRVPSEDEEWSCEVCVVECGRVAVL